jgi:hypothetical protein
MVLHPGKLVTVNSMARLIDSCSTEMQYLTIAFCRLVLLTTALIQTDTASISTTNNDLDKFLGANRIYSLVILPGQSSPFQKTCAQVVSKITGPQEE